MFSLHEHAEMIFEADTYFARVRCGFPQLLLNDGYDGIRIVDCITANEVKTIPFPEFDFAVYTWVVSPDGKLTYLFSSDELEYALEFDLDQGRSKKIQLASEFEVPTELCWFTPTLHILDYRYVVWSLTHDELVKSEAKIADKLYTAQFRRVTKRFVVDKMDPFGDGLYVRTREYPRKLIGHIHLGTKKDLLMEHDGTAIDVTHYDNCLFTAFDTEIIQFQDGKSESVLVAPEGEAFLRVNIIGEAGNWYLTVLSSTKDYLAGAIGKLSIYELRNGA